MKRPPVQRTWCETAHGQTFPRIQERTPQISVSSTHFQEVVAEIAAERIDHAISSFVRNQCCIRVGCLGSSSAALYLARAKGTPQPRESEAHPTTAWVQVPRIGTRGARCCLLRVTCHICTTSSLR